MPLPPLPPPAVAPLPPPPPLAAASASTRTSTAPPAAYPSPSRGACGNLSLIEQSAVRTAEAAAAAAASLDAGVEVEEPGPEFPPPLRLSVSTAALHPLSAAPTAACLQSALEPAAPCRISSTGADGAAASGQSLPRTQSSTTVVGPEEPSIASAAQGSSWRA